MKIQNLYLILLLTLTPMVGPLDIPTKAQDVNPQILLLHSLIHEKTEIEDIFANSLNTSTELTSINIDNFDANLDNFEILILASSSEFSLEDNQENAVLDFVGSSEKSIIIFTPYIEELDEDLQLKLGIVDTDEVYPEEIDSEEWNITLNHPIGNLPIGTETSYIGKYGVIEPAPNAKILGSITGTSSAEEEIQELSYPSPVIINASTSNTQIISSSIAPISNVFLQNLQATSIEVNSLPDIIDTIVTELIIDSITNHIINFQDSSLTDQSSANDPPFLINPLPDFSLILEFRQILLLGLLILSLFFYQKILGLIRWATERMYSGIIFVIGVFYNIQDRILDHSQVLQNNTRSSIMDYLEYISHYGAHLREIKSVIKTGMGALLWHLQVLEDFGWIEKYKINRYTVFVAAESAAQFDLQQKELEFKLKSKHSKRIIDTILKIDSSNSLQFSTLTEKTLIDRKTIKRIVSVLVKSNLLSISDDKMGYFRIENKPILMELSKSIQLRDEFQSISAKADY